MLKTIIIIIIIVIIFKIILSYIKRRVLFFPSKDYITTPESILKKLNNPTNKFVNIVINRGQQELHGWYFIQNPDYPTILVSHGNGGNISYRENLIQTLCHLNTNVCVYDYQGYGESTGNPSETNFYNNGETMMDYLINDLHVPLNKIILLGESIGSGVASYLAQKYQCSKLIILSGFSSVKSMFYHLLPQKFSLFSFIGSIVNEFPTSSYLEKFDGHTLILHSKDDDIVPYEQAVINSGNTNCQLVNIGGTHNQPIIDEDVLEQMQEFISINKFFT